MRVHPNRLLVVDDDESVRKLVVRLLSNLGYNVVEASEASEALRLAKASTTPIHALVTDVVMPGIQGPELARQLARSHPEIKIVYMSGYTRGAVEVDDTIVLVQKPFAQNDLAQKVRELLDRPD